MTQYLLFGAGVFYLLGAGSSFYENKPWLAITLLLYAGSTVSIYLAGRA